MNTGKRSAAPEMQVTSIRLESELKQRLRQISGDRGYQALIRDVLWQFVEQHPVSDQVSLLESLMNENRQLPPQAELLSLSKIRSTFRAIAQQEMCCAVTGELIQPQQPIWLGLTVAGELVPLLVSI